MNIEKLRDVQERIRAEGNVDMEYWVRRENKSRDGDDACGTVGCICGWAVVNEGLVDADNSSIDMKHPIWDEIKPEPAKVSPIWEGNLYGVSAMKPMRYYGSEIGQKLLELSSDQAKRLFYTAHWPSDWQLRYSRVESDRCARAKVVHDYIDWFIEHEGAGGAQ